VRISKLKRSVVAVGVVTVATTAWFVPRDSAHAAGDVITAAGADNSDPVVQVLFEGTGAYNVRTPDQLGSAEVTVPGDAYCGEVTYNATGTGTDSHGNPKILAPPGAQQGVDALAGSVAKTYSGSWAYTDVGSSVGGCVDIARSASLNKTPAILENYAFAVDAVDAVDAVSWASASLSAPAYL
jgi:hypothetical protein